MKGRQIITDKDHIMTEVEVFPSINVQRANTLYIGDSENIGFKGFGVAITGASCYNLSIMDSDSRAAVLNEIYSEEGLGLSVGRLCIGSSDYSAEIYSYDDEPFDEELKHFSIERDKRYIIPMIKEILKIKPDLYLFASPWSPPWWMKTGENMCGGYMRDKYVECYAEYIIKFLKAYEECGIKISALTPQNEPNALQSGYMPACVWHPETEARFIKVLKEKLKENRLETKVWMFDHDFGDAQRVIWQLEKCEGLREASDGIAFHYYGTMIEETIRVRRSFPEIDIHFTEGGPRLYDNYGTDWCKWGIMISKVLKYGYKSFTGWNLMLNEMGGPNVGPFLCGGLVTKHTVTDEISYSGQYRAFSHISPYINKDSKIYPVTVGEEFGMDTSVYPKLNLPIEGFMIDHGDGKTVLVLINPNDGKRQTQFSVNGVLWYAELTAESISTIILD